LSPKTCDNVDNKMLFLLSTLVFMHLGVICGVFLLRYWMSWFYSIIFIIVITELLTYIIDYQLFINFCHVLRLEYKNIYIL
jgi:hypothetical protein